jgi:hypothetical protein
MWRQLKSESFEKLHLAVSIGKACFDFKVGRKDARGRQYQEFAFLEAGRAAVDSVDDLDHGTY